MKSLVVLTVSILSAVSILFCPIVLAAPPSMPDDLQLVQPDPTLPKELTAFWGQWEGSFSDTWKLGQLVQMWIVVEKITEGKVILRQWRTDHGWAPRREATVTKENGKYKLWFSSSYGKIEMTLKDELLVWNLPDLKFSINFKRVAETASKKRY